MLASSVPGLRWWLALLVSTVALTAWRSLPVTDAEPAPAVRAAERSTYRYVPLLGLPLYQAIADAEGAYGDPPRSVPAGSVKSCLPFLAPILAYPNWRLRISTGYSTCFGREPTGEFTIASTGEVTWTSPGGPVRHLVLSSEQLALVRQLDRLSCVAPAEILDPHGWLMIGLDLGKFHEYGGASIEIESVVGKTVTTMLDELAAQYRAPRLELVSAMDLRLQTTDPDSPFRLRVAKGRITVERRGKRLFDEPIEPDLLLDLVDLALEHRPVAEPDVAGTLLLDGRSVPVALSRNWRGATGHIYRALDSALFTEAAQNEGRGAAD